MLLNVGISLLTSLVKNSGIFVLMFIVWQTNFPWTPEIILSNCSFLLSLYFYLPGASWSYLSPLQFYTFLLYIEKKHLAFFFLMRAVHSLTKQAARNLLCGWLLQENEVVVSLIITKICISWCCFVYWVCWSHTFTLTRKQIVFKSAWCGKMVLSNVEVRNI